jgi:hypothetical protein
MTYIEDWRKMEIMIEDSLPDESCSGDVIYD